MVKKYTANLSNWLKSKLNSVASNSKMDGVQSAGVSDLIARADHVHPSDTSKINEVDVQSHVVSFTNKDRVDISRLLNYMENGSGGNYYTLDLIGKFSTVAMDASSGSTADVWSDDKNRLAMTTHVSGSVNGHWCSFGGLVFKNGVAQPNDTHTITFKLIDGTVLGTDTFKRTSTGTGKDYRFYQANYRDGLFDTPGIYYVYAEATIDGSVIKSQILSVFVKENQNLFDMNLWSGGEYDNSLNNIQCNQNNQKCIITDEWGSIGETSFKLSRGGGTTYNWTRFRVPYTETGKTITVKCKIYNPNATADIWLCDMNGSTEGGHNGARIYPSNQIQETVLTYTGALSTVTHYAIRVNILNDGELLFIDDLSLTSI